MHQCGFAASGNSGDHRKPSDGEPDVDVLQIVGTGASDFDPVFDIAQWPARSTDGMAQRRLQAAGGLGIWILLDVAQRSRGHHLTTMNSRARPKINDMIGSPHCFFVVLDNN